MSFFFSNLRFVIGSKVTKTMFLMPDKKKTENDVFAKLKIKATKSGFVKGGLGSQENVKQKLCQGC